MKYFYSILLILTLSFGFILKTFTIVNYHINKTNFIQEFCINTEKPELKCEGKCHLTEQLKSTEEQSSNSQLPETITQFEISSFIVPDFFIANKNSTISVNNDFVRYKKTNILNGFRFSIFRPPIA